MGIFDFLKKKEVKKTITPQEIVHMAQTHEPSNIYASDGRHLNELVEKAVNEIMPLYDGNSDISTMLMLNDPSEIQANMKKTDVDTLLIFFKFLAIKAGETTNNQPIGVVQNYLFSVLKEKLS